MRLYILLMIGIATTMSCTQPPKPTLNAEGFEVIRISETTEKAVKKDPDGKLLEEGYLVNGVKSGVWLSYHDREDRIKKLEHYVDGFLDGVSLTFSTREQVDEKKYYSMDVLDGPAVKFEFGRPTEEAFYVNGKLHGMFKQYYRTGRLLKEVEFKNGIQDGIYRYYDEGGKVTVEWEYKNGEKVSGGIVENEGTQ